MAEEPESLSDPAHWNYFGYFTEIEEHFQRVRGSGLFLLSPLDWALIETWKNSDIPLEAVLRGIDAAFEKWNGKKHRFRQVNSLAYCAQAVYEEAQRMAGLLPDQPHAQTKSPFEIEDIRNHLISNAGILRGNPAFAGVTDSLERMAAELDAYYQDLEQLEQRLTALEEKLCAIAKLAQPEDDLLDARRELDAALRPYRGKMTADQLAMLERQFLDKRALENAGLPRLSLFYLRPENS